MFVLDDGTVVALPEFTSSFNSLPSIVRELMACFIPTPEPVVNVETTTGAVVSSNPSQNIESPECQDNSQTSKVQLQRSECQDNSQTSKVQLQRSDTNQDIISDPHEKETVCQDLPIQATSAHSAEDIGEASYNLFER